MFLYINQRIVASSLLWKQFMVIIVNVNIISLRKQITFFIIKMELGLQKSQTKS